MYFDVIFYLGVIWYFDVIVYQEVTVCFNASVGPQWRNNNTLASHL